MLTTTVITHKQKKIVYMDFRGIKLAENKAQTLELIAQSEKLFAKSPQKSVMALTNVEDSEFDIDLIQRMREFTKHNTPYIKKSAIVGVKGIQKTVYQAVEFFSKRTIPVFDNEEDAKDWLVVD